MSQAPWASIDATAPDAVAELCADLERSPLTRQVTLLHDPRWLAWLADPPKRMVRIYALHEQGELAGLAAFLVHPSAVPLVALGELKLISRPVRRLNAFAAPLVFGGGDRNREIAMLGGLLQRLREDLQQDEVVFLESVSEGTAMFDLVTRPGAKVEGFHALQNGKLYQHRFANIPGSFDGYLKQLGSRTRADLRANRKRFIAHVKQDFRTRCFRSPAEAPEFVTDAMEVSRKTYQFRLLGAGLREHEALVRCFRDTAERGWFRSYVLYSNERPIAFQVGHVYRGRFHAQEIGYDPDWAPHHVGIFLHTEIIADLAATGGAVTEFDFDRGDSLHKERLSTRSAREGYFYLIPAHLRGSLMIYSMRATHRVSAVLGAALERLGMRTKARDALRRLGVMK